MPVCLTDTMFCYAPERYVRRRRTQGKAGPDRLPSESGERRRRGGPKPLREGGAFLRHRVLGLRFERSRDRREEEENPRGKQGTGNEECAGRQLALHGQDFWSAPTRIGVDVGC